MVLGGVELIVFMLFVEEDLFNLVRISMFIDVGNVWDIEFDYEEYVQLNNGIMGVELLDFLDWILFRSFVGLLV